MPVSTSPPPSAGAGEWEDGVELPRVGMEARVEVMEEEARGMGLGRLFFSPSASEWQSHAVSLSLSLFFSLSFSLFLSLSLSLFLSVCLQATAERSSCKLQRALQPALRGSLCAKIPHLLRYEGTPAFEDFCTMSAHDDGSAGENEVRV